MPCFFISFFWHDIPSKKCYCKYKSDIAIIDSVCDSIYYLEALGQLKPPLSISAAIWQMKLI